MIKTLEEINQEFFRESYSLEKKASTDPYHEDHYGIDEFDPSHLCSLEDIQKTIDGLSLAETEPPAEQSGIKNDIVSDKPKTPREQQGGRKVFLRKTSDILFYAVIACILIVTLAFGGETYEGFHLLGYSGFMVLSGSMQREIPEGSLVITKSVDPSVIEIGDDITFVKDDNITVTHRVVNIIEDYQDSGSRGFQTKGLENPNPDSDVVHAGNVIGLVKLSIPELGYILSYASKHIGIVFMILGGILVSTIALSKALIKKEEDEEDSWGMEKAA